MYGCLYNKILLYGSKTWTLLQEDLRKLEVFHMCSQRMILGICWHDFGVYLDSELSFKQHITKVANSCFHHLRQLRQIRRAIDEDVMIQLVMAFVLSRIDYCNAVLAALPRSTIEPLQRVQNAAARLVFRLRSHDHITPALAQLHWLPVQFCINVNEYLNRPVALLLGK